MGQGEREELMVKQYYLSNNGTHIGPYTFETILSKVEAQDHQWTDYVYDEKLGEWMMLLEHPEFASKLNEKPPLAPQETSASPQVLKDKEWFILKEGTNYGPFCKLELVQMLQEK